MTFPRFALVRESDTRFGLSSRAGKSAAGGIGVEEAPEVPLVHGGLAGRHVVQLAVSHPAFEGVNQAEEVVEGIHHEKERLVMVDLETLVDDPLQLDRVALH